jgi:hypothetical protein
MTYRKILITVSIFIIVCGCKSGDSVSSQPTVEEPKHLASIVRANDTAVSSQLLNGFGAIEAQSWRWTAPHFTVALGVPPGADKNGASLVLAFTLPEISIKNLKSFTVSAKAGDAVLAPQTYEKAGAQTYMRDIPASAFKSEALQVQFDVDKFLQQPGDKRQLSLIVTSIQLEPK